MEEQQRVGGKVRCVCVCVWVGTVMYHSLLSVDHHPCRTADSTGHWLEFPGCSSQSVSWESSLSTRKQADRAATVIWIPMRQGTTTPRSVSVEFSLGKPHSLQALALVSGALQMGLKSSSEFGVEITARYCGLNPAVLLQLWDKHHLNTLEK